MTQYVGLDVADEETSVCVVDREGAVLVEAKVTEEGRPDTKLVEGRQCTTVKRPLPNALSQRDC